MFLGVYLAVFSVLPGVNRSLHVVMCTPVFFGLVLSGKFMLDVLFLLLGKA